MHSPAENGETLAREEADTFTSHGQLPPPSLIGEFLQFLRHNKKWWLIPILLVLGLLGLVVSLGGTAAAPWIYTLF